jgi:aspartate/methionine/tyrosine aminotransferase
MNPLAQELNNVICNENLFVYQMLSALGKNLYFPKGILSQTAEAKQRATRYNATIGIATEHNQVMQLPSVMRYFSNILAEDILPYAPSFGKPELRKRWRQEIFAKNPQLATKSSSLPIVTCGITHGLSLVGDLFIDQDDAILIPDKFWGNYKLIFELRKGAKIIYYPFFNSKKGFNVEGLKNTLGNLADKGKLIVLFNFPNNPTGYSITNTEAIAIRDTLLEVADRGCNLVCVFDDAYFGLFYEPGVLKESLYGYVADKHPRLFSIKLDAATKEDYAWGFRLGFITYNTKMSDHNDTLYQAIEKKTAGAIRGGVSNCPHHSQSILLNAIENEAYTAEKNNKFNVLCARAARVKKVLSDNDFSSVWEPYPFNSGYFMCLKLKQINAEDFRLHLLKKYGIGVISIGESDIRVAFSCIDEDNIPELFELMFKAAQDMIQDN